MVTFQKTWSHIKPYIALRSAIYGNLWNSGIYDSMTGAPFCLVDFICANKYSTVNVKDI